MIKKSEKAIKEMVRRIVEQFQPEKIILFGSYARGTAGLNSDVDLLADVRCSYRDKANKRNKTGRFY